MSDTNTLDINTECVDFSDGLNRIRFDIEVGDALSAINQMSANSIVVNCVVTSPPYYQKRRYGTSGDEIGWETTPR